MKSSSEGSLISVWPERDLGTTTSTCATCSMPKRRNPCKPLPDICSRADSSTQNTNRTSAGPVSIVWDDINDLAGPERGSFIQSPSGHKHFPKKNNPCSCDDDSEEDAKPPPVSERRSACKCSKPKKKSSKPSCPCSTATSSNTSAKFSSSGHSKASGISAGLPRVKICGTAPSPLVPSYLMASMSCNEPGVSLKSPEVDKECACDAALYNEFVYYCSALRLLIPSMTRPHSKENVIYWLEKLCEPGCACSETKENRNKYLFSLLVNVLNDESFGLFSHPPYETELTDWKKLKRYHIPKCAWESDNMWEDINETLPAELIVECKCGNADCKATKEISQQLDEEFRFFLHLARPFVEFMAKPQDRAIMSEWIQYLCAISPKSCDSKKSNRNNFMMALYGTCPSTSRCISKLLNDVSRNENTVQNRGVLQDLTNITNYKNILPVSPPPAASSSDDLLLETVSNVENEALVVGRRIIHVQHFINQLANISNHAPEIGCNLSCLEITFEKRVGLDSKFSFVCKMCKRKFIVSADESVDDCMNINEQAVSAIMSIGSGYSHLEMLTASFEIPGMSPRLYTSLQNTVCDRWEAAAAHCMAQAAKQEAEYAISEGNVSRDGKPMITVIADGCWSKRSYRTNYSALSGAAAIVGIKTGKVLYMGVKNKYCIICARSSNINVEPPQHTCYKNFSGPSTRMESTILVEGFKCSLDMYGLIYSRFIADGDSSTFKAILDSRPYKNINVEKIECKNHLLRNFCNALVRVTQDTSYPCEVRKVVKARYLRLRTGVSKAIIHWGGINVNVNFEDKVLNLAKDIQNGPQHVFGNHFNCSPYFCTPETRKLESVNLIPSLVSSGIMTALENLSRKLSHHARSLIFNVTSNLVESYNAQVAKFIGGKRINYSLRRSYAARCSAAVVSFNTGTLSSYCDTVFFGKCKNKLLSRVEKRRVAKLKKCSNKRRKNHTSVSNDSHYGANCQKPDLSPDLFEDAKEEFLRGLSMSHYEIEKFERSTVLQRCCTEWMAKRRNLLTSSCFGEVCKRANTTKCAPLVKKIVYGNNISSLPSVRYGVENEELAIKQLCQQEGITIESCGLFVDESLNFLGATPDGLYSAGIVEVKCPSSLVGLEIDSAMAKHTFWKYDKVKNFYSINKNHNWYFQVQGQLHITKRSLCLLAVWLGASNLMLTYHIERDDDFWMSRMEGKLRSFYFDCILPELVDPRVPRSMEIREPDYILKAIEEKKNMSLNAKKNAE